MSFDITKEIPVEIADFLTELDHKLLDESEKLKKTVRSNVAASKFGI